MLLVITRLVIGADWMLLDGRAAQHAVRGGHVDFACAGLVDQVGGAADRAGRADHVVEHQGDPALDRSADDVLLVRLTAVARRLSTMASLPPAVWRARWPA